MNWFNALRTRNVQGCAGCRAAMWLVLAGLALTPGRCQAAGKRLFGSQAAKVQTEGVSIEGVVRSCSHDQLHVRDKQGHSWTVMLQPNTRVQVRGKVDAEFLKSRRTVQFTAELDEEDHGRGTVGWLADRHSAGRRVGRVDRRAAAPAASRAGAKPAAKSAPGGAKHAAGKPDLNFAAKVAAVDPSAPPSLPKKKVVGNIVSYADNQLTVRAGERIITVETSKKPAVNLSVNDPKYIKIGSKVTVHGKTVRGSGTCFADSVNATLVDAAEREKEKEKEKEKKEKEAAEKHPKQAAPKSDAGDADAKPEAGKSEGDKPSSEKSSEEK